MITNPFKLITAGALVALLSSCGDTVIDNDDSNPVQTKATLNVRVRDASTGAPLVANLTLNSTGEKKATEATTGIISFNNVILGKHGVLIEKEGYATVVSIVSIEPVQNESGNYVIAQDATLDELLYPLTSSLSGEVLRQDNIGNSVAAIGDSVRYEAIGELGKKLVGSSKILTVAVDANGKYTFPVLPAIGADYSITVFDAAGEYKATVIPKEGVKLDAGASATINSFTLTPSHLNAKFTLTSYKRWINVGDTLVLGFNLPIAANKFNNSSTVTVTNVSGTTVFAADKKVEGNKVILIPRDKWPSEGFVVNFSNLETTNGLTISTTTEKINIISPDWSALTLSNASFPGFTFEQVLKTSADSANWNSMATVKLRWKLIDGALSYKIYGRLNGSTKPNELVYFGEIPKAETNDDRGFQTSTLQQITGGNYPEYSLYDGALYPLQDGNNVIFYIQAVNSSSETALKGAGGKYADSVIVADITPERKYVYNTRYIYSDVSVTNCLNNDGCAESYTTISFNEPVDTSGVSFGIATQGAGETANGASVAGRLKITHGWTNIVSASGPTTLRITFSAIPSTNTITEPVLLRYQISGIKDKAKNKLEVYYNGAKVNGDTGDMFIGIYGN
jgi:hypothetical protein